MMNAGRVTNFRDKEKSSFVNSFQGHTIIQTPQTKLPYIGTNDMSESLIK